MAEKAGVLPLNKGKANKSLRGDSCPTLVDEPCVAGSNPKINNKKRTIGYRSLLGGENRI